MCPKTIEKYLNYTQTKVFTPTVAMTVGQAIFPANKRRIGFWVSTDAGNSGSVIFTNQSGVNTYFVFISPSNNVGWDISNVGDVIQGSITNNQSNLLGVSFISLEYLDGFFD